MSLKLENVSYIYGAGTSTETKALKNISMEIEKGEFVAIIGHTGSGKSTLIQHFNGLEKATDGKVYYNGENIYAGNYDLKSLRCKVGLVFQYPEHQLFMETVLKDVCFGPLNMGLSREEAAKRAKDALDMVGMDASFYDKSPFEMSGGQKRRVAIAGVLAMEPDILVLDEPTAGLDPEGRDRILDNIKALHQQKKIGVVLVSHSMEDVAKYAQRIIVINDGKIVYDDSPERVFANYMELEKMGLAAPQITYIMHRLREDGLKVDENVINLNDAADSILKSLGR